MLRRHQIFLIEAVKSVPFQIRVPCHFLDTPPVEPVVEHVRFDVAHSFALRLLPDLAACRVVCMLMTIDLVTIISRMYPLPNLALFAKPPLALVTKFDVVGRVFLLLLQLLADLHGFETLSLSLRASLTVMWLW
jgi:hypothetical protein